MKKVLTIAGSDSGGGAGIQADLKTFAACGVLGLSAITALTAQNTLGVEGVHEVPTAFVSAQIDAVMKDMRADAWKTGMLVNGENIQLIAKKARHYQVSILVVDPVMVSSSGRRLLSSDAISALRDELLPLTTLFTPNHDEVAALCDSTIRDLPDMKEAAACLFQMMKAQSTPERSSQVLLKGGHLPASEKAIDLLFDGEHYTSFSAPRIDTPNHHGTGCTLASAIAAFLATGKRATAAVKRAKAFLSAALWFAKEQRVGQGSGPLQHMLDWHAEIDESVVEVVVAL